MTKPTKQKEWLECEDHYKKIKDIKLKDIKTCNDKICVDGLSLDISNTHVTKEILDCLLNIAKSQKVMLIRDKMFAGDRINNTENRSVLHTALRSETPLDVVSSLHHKMEKFIKDVRSGAWVGATGKEIKDIVNIGIGGSDLGARLASGALKDFSSKLNIHFVANIDGAEITDVFKKLDPQTTLFIIASKTFTTQETLTNANTARDWLVENLGNDAVSKHFVAVSSSYEKVESFGIDKENIFPMWDWVGGRYSVWSSVGLSVALYIGWDNFKEFLSGANAMDNHFKNAPIEENMPIILAMISIWYRNFWNISAEAVLPYSERLRDLPRYLQQLTMESNGKSVTKNGEEITYKTSPIIFGESGSVGQHSFHQWLHQSIDLVLCEFIGIEKDSFDLPSHHKILMAHMNAQIKALKYGKENENPVKANKGNKSSVTLMLNELTPYNLGMLLALYEHKVFVQGIVWDINSFDQYGVELGKELAKEIMKE